MHFIYQILISVRCYKNKQLWWVDMHYYVLHALKDIIYHAYSMFFHDIRSVFFRLCYVKPHGNLVAIIWKQQDGVSNSSEHDHKWSNQIDSRTKNICQVVHSSRPSNPCLALLKKARLSAASRSSPQKKKKKSLILQVGLARVKKDSLPRADATVACFAILCIIDTFPGC